MTSGLSSSSLSSDSNYFDTVARMIAEVADALDYAHTNGVLHRDMKPSNLLLSPAGRLLSDKLRFQLTGRTIHDSSPLRGANQITS
jgi:serine/threonine protein kinase